MKMETRYIFRVDPLTDHIIQSTATMMQTTYSAALRSIVFDWFRMHKKLVPPPRVTSSQKEGPTTDPAEKEGFEPSRRF